MDTDKTLELLRILNARADAKGHFELQSGEQPWAAGIEGMRYLVQVDHRYRLSDVAQKLLS